MQSETFVEIRHLIAQDDLATAISRLQSFLEDSPQLDEAIVQSARHRDILRQVRLGSVNVEQANQTKNHIRTGLLELLRELEAFAVSELKHADQDYKNIVGKIETNRGIGTSEILKNKTLDDLDKKELNRLFKNIRAIRLLSDSGQSTAKLSTHEKLVRLGLAENGHIFKGTFLCLGQEHQINAVCHTATESKFIQFKGTERNKILVLEDLHGNLLRQFEKMMLLMQTYIPLGRDREKSEDVYEIPIETVREFVANAFVHRNYSNEVRSYIQVELLDDRLEIKSPGHLPENLDVNHIEGTILINPVIAAIFHLYQHIERAGTGIRVAQQTLQANGLKPARIENINHPKMVKVTIFRNRYSPSKNTGSWLGRLIEDIKGVFS